MRISQAIGMVRPMPMAGPLIAAMIGLPRLSASGTSGLPSRASNEEVGLLSARASKPADQPPMSAPAQKPRPAPVTTSTRTCESNDARLTTSRNSFSMSGVQAFSFSGRLSVISPM